MKSIDFNVDVEIDYERLVVHLYNENLSEEKHLSFNSKEEFNDYIEDIFSYDT